MLVVNCISIIYDRLAICNASDCMQNISLYHVIENGSSDILFTNQRSILHLHQNTAIIYIYSLQYY